MAIHTQLTVARTIINSVSIHRKTKRAFAFATKLEILQRKALNKSLWWVVRLKKRSPHLSRHGQRIGSALAPAGIQQQITKPPRTAAIPQATAQEPHFVAATRRKGRVDLV